MGFEGHATAISGKLSGINIIELKHLLLNKDSLFPTFHGGNDNALSLGVDVSVIFHKLCSYDDAHETCVRKVGDFLNYLAHCGLSVYPKCDGRRSDTKLATFKRRSNAIKNDIDQQKARIKLHTARTQSIIHRCTPNHQVTALTDAEVKKLKKKAQRKPRQTMQQDFPIDLQAWLDDNGALSLNTSGGKVCSVVVSEWQADPLVAQNYINREFSIIVSNDTDYLMYIGRNAFMLSKFDFKKGGRANTGSHKAYENMLMTNIELSFASNEVLDQACSLIDEFRSGTNSINMQREFSGLPNKKYAKYDLVGRWENQDPELRALIGVALGCDVNPGGVKNIGPEFFHVPKKNISLDAISHASEKKELSFLKKLRTKVQLLGYHNLYAGVEVEERYFRFDKVKLRKYCSCRMRGLSHNEITQKVLDNETETLRVNGYVDAIMYEPTSVKLDCQTKYLHGAPARLSKWCSQFTPCGHNNGFPFDECPLADCATGHKYMIFDAASLPCHTCHATICRVCAMAVDDTIYCVECYKTKELNTFTGQVHLTWSSDELRAAIQGSSIGGQHAFIDDADHEWLLDYYESIVKSCSLTRKDVAASSEPIFPLLSPDQFHLNRHVEVLSTFNIRLLGASFLSHDTVLPYLPQIIKIFAKMVTFDAEIACPSMFVEWARKSRPSPGCRGDRIMERGLRHMVDPKIDAHPLEMVTFFKHNLEGEEKIGLSIEGQVPASMKNDIYPGLTACDEDGKLVCAECSCHAGGHGKERSNCPHSQCRGVCMTKCLTSGGLSDDVLFEIQNLVSQGKIHTDQVDETDLRLLISASNAGDPSDDNIAISDILKSKFSVGTERARFLSQVRVNPKEHGLLTDFSKDSVSTIAKKTFGIHV